MSVRLPAEWEPQDGILLPWPHPETDWADMIGEVEPVFVNIAVTASRFGQVLIIAPETKQLQNKLADAGVRMEAVKLIDITTNDTWGRDYGPITVYDDGQAIPLDFKFNGWGNKFPAELDNRVNSDLGRQGLFSSGLPIQHDMVLEGGSIESDGKGNLLTTSRCLLNPNRNPGLSKEVITNRLKMDFGLRNILWLNSGFLQGDDTDSHIDILARFAPDDTILYVACDDRQDPHYEELKSMRAELESFRTFDEHPYRILRLPMPAPCFDEGGNRLAATYANFLVINGAVLVPTYEDINDEVACVVIASAFPGREIFPVNCLPLISQGGSLHCSTMQLPKGVLA